MGTKTKWMIMIAVSVILAVALLCSFSWFSVRGSELRFLQDLPSDCEASVTIWSWDGVSADRNQQEKVLTQDQLSQILQLLQSSSYWRDPSPGITHHEQYTYVIFITYNSNSSAQYLSITSSGGYAVNISGSQDNPYNRNFLRIRNKEWVSRLDAILALS